LFKENKIEEGNKKLNEKQKEKLLKGREELY
jgi:hypothetical protein